MSYMAPEEGKDSQNCANTQHPVAQDWPEPHDAQLSGFRFKFSGMRSGIVVAEALGYDHASSAIDKGEYVVSA